jgi:hypothetical protein
VDSVLFANFKVYTKGKEGQKHKAVGDGTRVMYTDRRPAYDAKNRFGLPLEMPLSYTEYRTAVERDPNSKHKEILAEIHSLLESVDKETEIKVVAVLDKAGSNVDNLIVIRNRLKTIVMEKENGTQ